MKARDEYYIFYYVPDVTQSERTAIGVVLIANDGASRHSYFLQNSDLKVQPPGDVTMLHAIGDYISKGIAGEDYQSFLGSLVDSMGNNVLIEGPHKVSSQAYATTLRDLCKLHLRISL